MVYGDQGKKVRFYEINFSERTTNCQDPSEGLPEKRRGRLSNGGGVDKLVYLTFSDWQNSIMRQTPRASFVPRHDGAAPASDAEERREWTSRSASSSGPEV